MNKSPAFFAALFLALASCQEEKAAPAEEVTIVEIPTAQPGEAIDWNYEIALIKSEAVRQKAATALDLDPASLHEIKIEADITNQQIRIIGPHRDAIASAYKSVRLDASLTKLEDHLKNQTGELLPTKPDENPDQMTYQKALQALEEEPVDDGVIYRKTPEE